MTEKHFKGKRLLVLAGADVHSKIVKAAKDLGAYTIVTDNLPPEEAPAKKLADEYWMLNIFDTDAIIQKSKESKIDGILAFCIDPAQLPYQKIADAIDLPCYGTKFQFETFTNKSKFRDFCKQNNVSVVPSYSLEEIESDKVKYPLLVKPAESRGSRGQSVCNCKEEIPEAIEKARGESKDGNFIIERFMGNARDMSFSYVVINKEPYLLKIGDRYLGDKEDRLERQHIATLLPSRHAAEYVEKVEPRVKRMIQNLGLEFGAVFLQGFWEDGEVYFYDPGLRFPGGDFDIALKIATGYDNMTTFVKYALSGDITACSGNPQEAYKLKGKKCLILSLCARPGTIDKIEGFETIQEDSQILSASLRYKEGDTVPPSSDIRQRVAEFVALLPDDKKYIRDFINKIYDTIHFLDSNGKEMLVSKLNLK